MTIDERVTKLEERMNNSEVMSAKIDERLSALIKATNNLTKVVYGFALILLLTVVYGAIGKDGFNQVTQASNPVAIVQQADIPTTK